MALCDHCQAEIEGKVTPMDIEWFDEGCREVAGYRLTPDQWAILRELHIGLGRTVRHNQLYQRVYGARSSCPGTRVLPVQITRLRKALVGTPYRIILTWGVGYRLMKEQYTDIH